MPSARHRTAVALAATSAAAAAGFARLFADAGWVLPVGAAVVGAHGVAAATRRWSWPRAAAAHLAALTVLLTWAAGGHTVAGFPTPAGVPGLAEAAGRAVDAFRAAIVPAPSTPELVAWAVAGIWLCAAAADGLARRCQAGLLAVVPLVVVHALVATLGTARWRPLTAFAFAAAVCGFAAVERAEGMPRGWAVSGSGRACRPALSSLALAVVVAGAALALGPVVPGGASPPLLDVHALGVQLDVSRVELNPLVDLRPQLSSTTATELFTVRSPQPAYWRLTALERFDGRLWSPARPVPRPLSSRAPATGARTAALRQEFRIAALDSPWLPAAHQALEVRAPGARLDPETDSVVTRRGSRHVGRYEIDSRLPEEAEQREGGDGSAPGDELRRYLELPGDFPASVRALARRFVAGTSGAYDRAVALEDHLKVGYAYNEDARPGHGNDDLEHFLFRSLHGYCEQFAGAFAAMARSLGIPARVAVGFTPGTYDAGAGVWRVTTREAHAWPEVHISGKGWVPFEPTPGRSRPDGETGGGATPRLAQFPRRPDRARPAGDASSPPSARVLLDGLAGRDAGPLAGDLSADGGRPWWLAGAAGLAGVALLVPPGAKGWRRRARRLGHRGDPVAAAWAEALDRLAEADLVPGGAETPLEFAARAGRARPGTGPPLTALAGLANGSAYGRRPADAVAARRAWEAAAGLVRALDAGDPRWRRGLRRIDPRRLLRAEP